MSDLFLALSVNRYSDVVRTVEARIEELFNGRHAYPIWPDFGDAVDDFEDEWYKAMRKPYYESTKILCGVLRVMREGARYETPVSL